MVYWKYKNMSKFLLVGVAVIIALAAGVLVVLNSEEESSVDDYVDLKLDEGILSFEDCVRAGYPVMESYPRRCALPDGRVYTEEIEIMLVYENASSDLIVIDLPYPGAVTGKEFLLKGSARGNWFFEAVFPVEVVASDGEVLVSTYATAEGDWMTTDFVPFNVTVSIPEEYIGTATLILRKDNPSALPENDASVSFPINIEY